VKNEPDWARWRAWLIAASATAVPSGVTAACTSIEVVCAGVGGDYASDAASDRHDATPFDAHIAPCAPGDVTGFVPTWKPPTGFLQGRCTDVQAAAFVDCLTGAHDAATCKTFFGDAANKNCIKCALTNSTASAAAYGPLIADSVTVDVNEPGCIAHATDDVSATGCGAKLLALRQCERASCETNCPVQANDDGTAYNALLACQKSAASTTCKAYAVAATCAVDLEDDAGPAAVCAQKGATFSDNAEPTVKLFCGGIAGDGGIGDAGDGG
jgi:hypothetical protein